MTQAFIGKLIAPLYVFLSPFVSALAFLCAVILAIACTCWDVRRNEPRIYLAIVVFAILFGLYTIFNVYDYLNYRRYGLAKSPINEAAFFLFSPPDDLHRPYVVIPLSEATREYVVEFKHRYGGQQEIVLNLINNAPKEFEYGEPDQIDIDAECVVTCVETGEKRISSHSFSSQYLHAGTNSLVIARYSLKEVSSLSRTYKVEIRLNGAIGNLLNLYPGSYLALENGTVK